jgi:hypothetical protein
VKSLSRVQIIAKCLEIIDGFEVPNRAWGEVLYGEVNQASSGMKDIVFPLYWGCMRDLALTIDHEKDRARVFRSLDTINDYVFCHNVRQVFGVGIYAAEVLCRLSQEEQVFLEFCRNRLAHGYLDGETNDQKTYTIMTRPFGKQSLFLEITFEKDAKQRIVSSFGEGDILAGAKRIREKYDGIFEIFYRTILNEFRISSKDLEPHLKNGNVISTISEKEYQAFVDLLNHFGDDAENVNDAKDLTPPYPQPQPNP